MFEPKYYLRATQGERVAYFSYVNGERLFHAYGDAIEYTSAEKIQEDFDYFLSFKVQSYDDLPYELKYFANRNDGQVDVDIVLIEPFKIKGYSFNTYSPRR